MIRKSIVLLASVFMLSTSCSSTTGKQTNDSETLNMEKKAARHRKMIWLASLFILPTKLSLRKYGTLKKTPPKIGL